MDTGYQALGVFLLVAFFLILLLSRPRKARWYSLSEYTRPLSRKLMTGSIAISMAIVVFVCFIKTPHSVEEPDEVLQYSNTEELHYQTFWACYTKLRKNPYDLRAHYFINVAYHAVQSSNGLYELRKLLPSYRVFGFTAYENMADTGHGIDRDLGFFGMGMIRYLYYDDNARCRQYLDSVKNKNLPFVNYLYSRCIDDPLKKITLLKKDLQLEPTFEAAETLSTLYARMGYPAEMDELIYSDRTSDLVPPNAKLGYAFHAGHFFDFLLFSLESTFRHSTALSIGGSLFILLLWFGFLFALDLFEREKPSYIFFALLLGAIMAILCRYLYSLFDYILAYQMNDSLTGDFLYSVFVIGAIEEFVKIIPLLLLLRFTRILNEPMDYILYACLGALGFSVIEDIMYFNNSSVSTIYSRAIFTSLSHMANSAVIAYFLVVAKYRDASNVYLAGIKGFLLACFIHGFYDFFILNDTIRVWFIPFAVLLVQAWWLAHAVNNCLNNSPFYTQNVAIDIPLLAVSVSGGLLLLISFVFLHIAVFMSDEYALMRYFYALLYYFYPIFFFNISVKKIDVFPGHWEPLHWRKILNPAFFFAGVNPKYYLLNGKNIVLTPLGKHTRRAEVFPLRARIVKREKIDGYTGWFKIETERPVIVGKIVSDTFLMRAKEEFMPYEGNARNASYLCVIKPEYAQSKVLCNDNLLHFDWVSVKVLG